MPERLTNGDVLPDLQRPEARAVMAAFVDLLAGCTKLAGDFERRGHGGLDLRDVLIVLHLMSHMEHGTRQQHLIDTLDIPRRTIRGKLKRLERDGVLARDGQLYYPTSVVGEVVGNRMQSHFREIGRLSDAWAAYCNAIRRVAPIRRLRER